jgi:hypothetical protein
VRALPSLCFFPICALIACADPAEGEDGGLPSDSGVNDSGAPDLGPADQGPRDVAPTDRGPDDLGPGDAGPNADAETNADAAPTDGGRETCREPYTLDGVFTSGIGQINSWSVLPAATTPTTITGIVETGDYVAGALVRLAPDGFVFSSQVSHLTRFDSINFEHFVVDPSDGATYAVVEQQVQGDGLALRVYNADGTLAREFTRDGPSGQDLIGASRQSNFFLIKYNQAGVVQWASRFGPNRNTDRAGQVLSVGLTPTGVRVVAEMEGGTQLAFAPGSGTQLTYEAPAGTVFWGEIDKADGGYVSGSFRRIDSSPNNLGAVSQAIGDAAHSAIGETAIAGVFGRPSGSGTFTFGAPSGQAVTTTATVSTTYFAKLDGSGNPAFLATARILDLFASPSPRAVGLSASGVLVAGGQFPASERIAEFGGTNGPTQRAYASEESWLVAYSGSGERQWLRRIEGQSRNGISKILVTDEAAYVLGTHAAGTVLGRGDPNQRTLNVGGYVLSKYNLTTGAFEWAWVLTSEAGTGGIGGFEVWSTSAGIVVPIGFTTVRLVGPGGEDRIFDSLTNPGMTGAAIFSPGGQLLGCQAIAAFPGRFQAF